MQGLRAIGVQLAIDNFGTGYSSLAYLSNLPVDVLHIDRSHVNNLTTLADHANLVIATIRLAHSLGLSVVAEGVEKKDQLQVLTRLDCDMMQGFLFSKPVPPNELGDLLRQGRSLWGATEA
jgi:EAL domain-containing protein (putative c-di-GMP-specific phosphodiesterase class I)